MQAIVGGNEGTKDEAKNIQSPCVLSVVAPNSCLHSCYINITTATTAAITESASAGAAALPTDTFTNTTLLLWRALPLVLLQYAIVISLLSLLLPPPQCLLANAYWCTLTSDHAGYVPYGQT